MKLFSSLVFGALVSSIALLPFAALADDGLTLLVFVTPPGRDVGQMVDVNVEAYLWGAPVNPGTVAVTIGFGTDVTLTNVSTGKWHGTYRINASDALFGTILVNADASLDLLSGSDFSTYQLPDGSVSVGWEVKTRIANQALLGLSPAPGSNVVIEGRTYLDGTLKDGGPLNATARVTEGATSTDSTPTGTKVADGVYQFTIQVPADVATGRLYSVEVKLGTGLSAPSDFQSFQVNPVPVAAWIQTSTPTSAVVKVLAGSTSAIAGANVSVSGEVITFIPFGSSPIAPVTGITDAKGQATINVSWTGTGAATLMVNVTSGGKMSTVSLYAFDNLGSTGWIPMPNIPFGCSAALQSDPSAFEPGDTANLKVRVTEDGTLQASTSLTRILIRSTASGSSQAGNVTTDAQGNFTVTYLVPSDWKESEQLEIMVVCPSGSSTRTQAEFSSGAFQGTGNIHVTATPTAAGGKLHVTATYSGGKTLVGIIGGAFLIPGSGAGGFSAASASNPPFALFTQSGTTFTGDIDVPAFYPEGDYSLIVGLTNTAAVSLLSDEVSEGNVTTVHIGAAGGPGGGTGGGLLPGFEGFAAVAAVGAGAAIVAIGRRRRVA